MHQYLLIHESPALHGEISLCGAKNAVLVIMSSLLLTSGISRLRNVPFSDDVFNLCELLRELGASITTNIEHNELIIDTSKVNRYTVNPAIMNKMRASILVMGPLLARFGKAEVAFPGGCILGPRPINYHLKGLAQLGVEYQERGEFINAAVTNLQPARIILEYPSVGATENILMLAVHCQGKSTIINAALEPEVLDLISVLQQMGASITIKPPATLEVIGVTNLNPVDHTIIPDRLEAGTLLLATAITGGSLHIPNAPIDVMDVFLDKLYEMGHDICIEEQSLRLIATSNPRAVSFKTMPYPGFPTDLLAPMMAAQCLAAGTSFVHETVYENRFVHVRELQKLGAQIELKGQTAVIKGVDALYGSSVIAPDIRSSAALIIAAIAAEGTTTMTGLHHLTRGYHKLDEKLRHLGANLVIQSQN